MTVQEIIDHIKELENDNNSSVDTFIETLLYRFAKRFARELNHTSLIFSATTSILSTGETDILLASNFIKPLHKNAIYLIDNYQTKFEMVRAALGFTRDLNKESYYLTYWKNNKGIINSPYTGTLKYWYIGHMPTVALSAEPDIPEEYLIQGTRALYRNSMGFTTDAEMYSDLYQVIAQAKTEDQELDKKINSYIINDNKLTSNFRR